MDHFFDGIGTFPLSGLQYGFTPVWASEIEAFPIAVTKHHFPDMKHLGDITKINGAEIEPVEITLVVLSGHERSQKGRDCEVDYLAVIRESDRNGKSKIFDWENVPSI